MEEPPLDIGGHGRNHRIFITISAFKVQVSSVHRIVTHGAILHSVQHRDKMHFHVAKTKKKIS